jgi:hypothetical protein
MEDDAPARPISSFLGRCGLHKRFERLLTYISRSSCLTRHWTITKAGVSENTIFVSMEQLEQACKEKGPRQKQADGIKKLATGIWLTLSSYLDALRADNQCFLK